MKTVLRAGFTLLVAAAALLVGYQVWNHYLYSPWTRDGRVRAEVITLAPDVSGWITHLDAANNREVKAGDLLFTMDDQRYKAAIAEDEATVEEAKAALELAEHQFRRRQQLNGTNAISQEDLETFRIHTDSARAALTLARARLAADRIDLERTRVTAPADGTLINPGLNAGSWVSQGKSVLSLVKANSFYVTGYFEETKLAQIHEGQQATITLMGYPQPLTGTVIGIGRGIANANTTADGQLLPQVQQTFNWVRLAQRIPVDIRLDAIPADLHLSSGMSASVHLQAVATPSDAAAAQ
ncbi:HlyD family secretion protein [Parathalassolituus penaei]|uniref:HlyD family secretion protein n=1 Tax=Parathalassolituus penaei TaxID=2997323 RepID=A0A9X3EHK7_9GAMM|nr:HlyD family secretion protein [Parathalassolituus penaei]MCY0967316.1 HlyD family secretion protein [Parathalassolituus penaei]